MNKEHLEDYLKFAKDVALSSGKIMRQYSRINQEVEIKEDTSPVTIADKAINRFLIDRVKDAYPDHGVIGEEEVYRPDEEMVWVCDPIDGTAPFIMHIPLAVFSLALVVNGSPLVAVTYNPFTDELYHATKGGGSHRNDEKILVSSKEWGSGVRLLGSSSSKSKEPVDDYTIRQDLVDMGISVTNLPGTVFKGCLVAEGSADGRIFVHNGAHDIAAIKLIVEEAGGKVTSLDGSEQQYNKPINGAVMSNGLIHDELLQLVKAYESTRN